MSTLEDIREDAFCETCCNLGSVYLAKRKFMTFRQTPEGLRDCPIGAEWTYALVPADAKKIECPDCREPEDDPDRKYDEMRDREICGDDCIPVEDIREAARP